MRIAFGSIAALLLLSVGLPARAQAPAWSSRAAAAATLLEQTWGTADGWKASENWQRFPIAQILLDYQRRTGDTRLAAKIAAAVRNRAGRYLNDDDLWAVIASVDAWESDHDPELLAWAATNFTRLVSDHWDDHCGGGIWWDPRHGYKNAITNELLLTAATRLYRATGQQAYRDWSLHIWDWFAASGMIGPDGLVNDGLDPLCRNNGAPRYTYNQGVLLGGLNDLTAITGDPQYRAIAVRTALAATRTLVTPQGLLTEPSDGLGADGPMFKGVFVFHLGHLVAAMPDGPDRTELSEWLTRNGDAVWALSGEGSQPVDGLWSGGSGQTGAAAEVSALALFLAAGA
ncbi:glycoside hydrolase family 76 protein [Novosphingobium sp.]|uniref:glycoside hydrolase family 76 protein n=1 Tax=Novosphingobium sp. TaxID=1874826 RepID=UPI002616CF30|nr:glycoside hydrolase family 76 protein [Novosphingobium sp.]